MGADAVFAVVIDRAQPEAALAVAPAALDGDELLVGGGQVLGAQGEVGGAQQPLAVVVRLAFDGGAVDAQQPARGAPQQPAQPRLVLEGPDELVAAAFGPGVGALDQPFEVLDEPLAHRCVPFGGIRVVAHHEPLCARPVLSAATGCHPDLLDPQIVGHVVVTAGAGQRGGGLGVGVAQLLGVDVVPAAAGEIGAVGRGGEAAVDDPHQPVQVPGSQVVFDRADDPLVTLVTGKRPAAHRDAVAGDRHRDHHLGQVVAVVLGLAEPTRPALDHLADPLIGPRFGLQVGQLVGAVDLPLRHQREQHPFGRAAVDATTLGDPTQRCADAELLPELLQQPRPAEASRVQHLDVAGVRGGDRLLRLQEPRDRGDQPGQRVAVHGVGATEAVDHLRRGNPGHRVALAVRQLQIADHAAVAVTPLRLPQVHTYTAITYPLVKSSDTPELVCLQEFAVRAALQASYQRIRSARPRNMPTNSGSRVREVEELMLVGGVAVSYQRIRRWCAKFGQAYANQLRRRRPRPGDKWHLDEVFVGINGRLRYLWRAVDQHGNVLDVLVRSRRHAVAAK